MEIYKLFVWGGVRLKRACCLDLKVLECLLILTISEGLIWLLQIGVKGAEYLSEALQYNSTISTLDLRANSLGDDVSSNSVCPYVYQYFVSLSESSGVLVAGCSCAGTKSTSGE